METVSKIHRKQKSTNGEEERPIYSICVLIQPSTFDTKKGHLLSKKANQDTGDIAQRGIKSVGYRGILTPRKRRGTEEPGCMDMVDRERGEAFRIE